MFEKMMETVSCANMSQGVKKYWDFINRKPNAPFYQKEFGFYSLDRWYNEGLEKDTDLSALFGFDEEARFEIDGLGWCTAGYEPWFEEKILKDQGEYELVQDNAGRAVLYFKGRRDGFMPEYVDHPVKDEKSWEEKCHWRLDPQSPERLRKIEATIPKIKEKAAKGIYISQMIAGGYGYLRSMIGPTELMYMFYDNPSLIHKCMRAWFELADETISRYQQSIELNEVFISEDICYNAGPLISPKMIKEFLFPYYQQLLTNCNRRCLNKARRIDFQVDTDGRCLDVIDLYREIGMTSMSPFEVAAGSDVVEIGKLYPDLLISGGIDKRILAKGKDEIDRMIDHIFPVMQKRGGYLPTCDHGVPEEVSLENYLYFRKRCLEYA